MKFNTQYKIIHKKRASRKNIIILFKTFRAEIFMGTNALQIIKTFGIGILGVIFKQKDNRVLPNVRDRNMTGDAKVKG